LSNSVSVDDLTANPGPWAKVGLRYGAAYLWRRVTRHLPAAVAAICGVWITAIVFMAIDRGDDQRVTGELQQRAEWRTRDLEVQLHRASVPVATLAAHLSSTPVIDRAGFEAFAKRMLSSGTPLLSIEWRPGTTASRSGASATAEDQARDQGKLFAALPRDPAWAVADGPAIIMIWPVYRSGEAPASVEQRRAEFLGFVTASYPVRSLLVTALKDTPSPLSIWKTPTS
jgi:hypothetical protein